MSAEERDGVPVGTPEDSPTKGEGKNEAVGNLPKPSRGLWVAMAISVFVIAIAIFVPHFVGPNDAGTGQKTGRGIEWTPESIGWGVIFGDVVYISILVFAACLLRLFTIGLAREAIAKGKPSSDSSGCGFVALALFVALPVAATFLLRHLYLLFFGGS